MPNHQHDSIEINYVAEGTARYLIDHTHEIVLQKGWLLFLNGSRPHKLEISDPTCRATSLQINTDVTQKICQTPLCNEFRPYFIIKNHPLLSKTYRCVTDAIFCSDDVDFLYAGLAFILQLAAKERRSALSDAVRIYISHYYYMNPTASEIALNLHVSKAHLQRVFKQDTGITIQDYATKIKMEHAAHMLTTTLMSVEEILEKVGINSQQVFYRRFKKEFGVTPNQYRIMTKPTSTEDYL